MTKNEVQEQLVSLEEVLGDIYAHLETHGVSISLVLGVVMALLEKGVVTEKELMENWEVVARNGLAALGIEPQDEEISAEDRYEAEGIKVWDGTPKNQKV